VGRKHRQLLLAAGFGRTEARAVTFGGGTTPEVQAARATWLKAQLVGIARTALEKGWLDQDGIDAIAADIDAWAARADAVFFTVICETLGWVTA
jgi:hypothetical protein